MLYNTFFSDTRQLQRQFDLLLNCEDAKARQPDPITPHPIRSRLIGLAP